MVVKLNKSKGVTWDSAEEKLKVNYSWIISQLEKSLGEVPPEVEFVLLRLDEEQNVVRMS